MIEQPTRLEEPPENECRQRRDRKVVGVVVAACALILVMGVSATFVLWGGSSEGPPDEPPDTSMKAGPSSNTDAGQITPAAAARSPKTVKKPERSEGAFENILAQINEAGGRPNAELMEKARGFATTPEQQKRLEPYENRIQAYIDFEVLLGQLQTKVGEARKSKAKITSSYTKPKADEFSKLALACERQISELEGTIQIAQPYRDKQLARPRGELARMREEVKALQEASKPVEFSELLRWDSKRTQAGSIVKAVTTTMNNGLRRFTFDVGSATQVFHPPDDIRRSGIRYELEKRHVLKISFGRQDGIPLLKCHLERKDDGLQLVCEETEQLRAREKQMVDWLVIGVAERAGKDYVSNRRCIFPRPNRRPEPVTIKIGFKNGEDGSFELRNDVSVDSPDYPWPERLVVRHKVAGEKTWASLAVSPWYPKLSPMDKLLKLSRDKPKGRSGNRRIYASFDAPAIVKAARYARAWRNANSELTESKGKLKTTTTKLEKLSRDYRAAKAGNLTYSTRKLQLSIKQLRAHEKTLRNAILLSRRRIRMLRKKVPPGLKTPEQAQQRLDVLEKVYRDNANFDILDPWDIKIMTLHIRFQQCRLEEIRTQ